MNYQALVQLGFLENKPFESAHPAIHGFHVFSYVMKNHIKFTQQFLNAVKDRSNKIGGKNCISFHVRMGDLKSDFKEKRCFLHESDLTSFAKCSIVSINPEMPIFISSDSSYAKSIINQTTNGHQMISFTKRASYTSNLSFEKSYNSIYQTFLDLVTLGSCSELVGTYGSTFSILAASLIGKLPYLIAPNSTCEIPEDYFYL